MAVVPRLSHASHHTRHGVTYIFPPPHPVPAHGSLKSAMEGVLPPRKSANTTNQGFIFPRGVNCQSFADLPTSSVFRQQNTFLTDAPFPGCNATGSERTATVVSSGRNRREPNSPTVSNKDSGPRHWARQSLLLLPHIMHPVSLRGKHDDPVSHGKNGLPTI